jgi:hypothetical protein
MATLTGQLIQDSVSLIQFVSSLADLCEEKSGATAHLPSSERPGHGWVNEVNAYKEAEALMNGLSATEQNNIRALVKIPKENGSFPSDSPILNFLK